MTMTKRLLVVLAFILGSVASVQAINVQDTAGATTLEYRLVSGTNVQQQHVFDSGRPHDTLAIHAVCSAGTAALTVEVSVDNANWLTIDSLVAASPQIKQYTATTVGAGIALSPLSARFLRITVATCGGGNTSTLTVAAK